MVLVHNILANFQISEKGINERKSEKKRDIPIFSIHCYVQIFAKRGPHGKITLFFASKRGTVGKYETHFTNHFNEKKSQMLECSDVEAHYMYTISL